MGGLILIIPILAFNIWLFCTTGWRQVRRWFELKQWRQFAAACAIGLALAVWLTFFVQYGNGLEMRKGFPIPLLFFHPDDKTWTNTDLPVPLLYASIAADFLTGLAAPFIPYKIGEFMKQVKAELK
jgi:hypothetical protein